jgi:hypothetical protein
MVTVSHVHPEVVLAAGYAVLLLAAAFGLEWLARRAHRRSEAYELAGFVYHRNLDVWECPTGQHLLPTRTDHLRQLVHYRARPTACNSCPLKTGCTDSDDGRELTQPQATWPHSEVARFHRGLSLLLVGLAAVIILIAGARHYANPEVSILSGPAILLVLTARCLLPALRTTRGSFG